ncbi:MAG: hypothetical protein JO263_10595 [Candidatus Eremiobacteraeota bacterium]|nr:hypothetical protein [Candidatus Eremiobacteraeota bacterium]
MLFALILIAQVMATPVPSTPPTVPPPTAPPLPSIYIARGTVIPVTVTKDVRVGASGTDVEERKVRFAVTQDVIVDGYVIAKAGDLVEGHFTNQQNVTHRTFETTTSQEVTLDLDDAVNFCGDTIHLGFERTFVGGVRSGFLSFGVHAHDAVFGKGLVLKAATDRAERSICAQPTSATPLPLPGKLVLPDNAPPARRAVSQ